ncbi:MAG: hypothetical protein Q7S03_01380 [bacterium]|nr:hypothetical protein [bacterium]
MQTSAEGFYLAEQNVNYCINCGKKYSEVGVDISKLYRANKARINIINKALYLYILFPLVGFLVLIFLGLSAGYFADPKSGSYLMVLLVGFTIYMIGVMICSQVKGGKKFKELIAE